MNAFHMPGSFRTRNPFESQYLVKSPRSPLLLTPVRLSQHVHPQWVGSSAGRPEDSWSVSPPGLLPSHGISVLPHIVSDTAQDMVGGMKFPFPWIYIYTTAWGAAADVSGGWQEGGLDAYQQLSSVAMEEMQFSPVGQFAWSLKVVQVAGLGMCLLGSVTHVLATPEATCVSYYMCLFIVCVAEAS